MDLSFLTQRFARFVRARGLGRHFRRLPTLEGLSAPPARDRRAPPSLARDLARAATDSPSALLERLGSHPEGLSDAQAAAIRGRIGLNVIAAEKPAAWWLHLWHCYRTPFDLLLTLLALISFFTEDHKATGVIGSMVILSVAIRFWQERQSGLEADRLKAMVGNTATVLRRDHVGDRADPARPPFQPPPRLGPAHREEVPIAQLVPGDVLLLSAGDLVPADGRIVAAKDLFVAQAAMTGESLPVEKHADHRGPDAADPLALDNIVFMGTNVVSGSATVVVVGTGGGTMFGALAQDLTQSERAPTQFQGGVNRVAWLLIRFMAVMTPLVLLINGFTKGDWTEAFLFAMSVAVGLTPEMLPMIVTSTLAKGAVALSRRQVVVKRLDAIQNFGAMDVLCTDKTGTLTQDRVALARHTDLWGQESVAVLEAAYLNSWYQTGLKNLLDAAVLEHSGVELRLNPADRFRKVDEIPFDFQRRRMSVVVAEGDDRHRLICKGAVEEVLATCTHVRRGDVDEPLTPERLERVRVVTGSLNAEGLRVVAVATRDLPAARTVYGVGDEAGLTLLGYVAFLDPPKDSARPALKALQARGIRVKVLTGDNERVTARVCQQVGLAVGVILTGPEIEQLDDAALSVAVRNHDVFARLAPAQKERIVRALRAAGHVVGFMGDGINDAPALHAADIGISVDTAVDIAKESADIILLEKSLRVLEQGVAEGRRTFANLLKYIRMTASSNFGNVLSVLVASAFIPFLPMLPMHLLVQNLLYDLSQVAIPFDAVDEEQLRTPQRWNPDDLLRFMLCFGPLSSVFDLITFGVLWFLMGADSVARQTLFQSGWFVEGLMTQILIVHMIRTRHIPFLRSRAAPALMAGTLAVMALGVFLSQGPLAHYFKLQALPWTYFGWLAAILAGYMVMSQGVKAAYARRYGWS